MERVLGLVRKFHSFNNCLSGVDKLNYLRGLLISEVLYLGIFIDSGKLQFCCRYFKGALWEEVSRSTCSVDETVCVKDERDLPSLRRLCDRVETHYRGLEAVGIVKNTYSSIVVPHILDWLPKSVCLIITREKEFHKWAVVGSIETFEKRDRTERRTYSRVGE